jgi:hypothetical protein
MSVDASSQGAQSQGGVASTLALGEGDSAAASGKQTLAQQARAAAFGAFSDLTEENSTGVAPWVIYQVFSLVQLLLYPLGPESTWNGAADEFALYPSALSAATVAAHYANGTSASPSTPYQNLVLSASPIAYYRLGEATYTAPTSRPVAVNTGSAGTGKKNLNLETAAGALHSMTMA